MATQDEELLAAVSGAVTGSTQENTDDETNAAGSEDTLADGSEADDSAGADESTDESSSDDADAEDDGDAGDGGEETAEQKAAKASKTPAEELGEDGKPLTAEQKKAKEEAANAEASKKDPINAPISQYLKPATQERMRALVEIAKTTTAERDHYKQQSNDIIGMVTDTGANAQQYTQALGYLKAVNSRDPVQIRAAKQFLQAELEHLSRMSGEAIPGVNGYEQHADLKAAVAAGLSADVANELAAGRAQRQWQTQDRNAQTEAQRAAQEQQQTEHNEGRAALNSIGKQLAAKDVNYAKKAPLVLKEVSDQLKAARPSQWAQIFLTAYSTFQLPVTVVPKKPAARQPLRGNNPAGGQQPTVGSIEEAISLGIARAGR